MAEPIPAQNLSVRKPLGQERLKQLLHYDPLTGIWTWRVDRGFAARANVRAGDVAGTPNDNGYRVIGVEGGVYRASHLAVLYMTGELPGEEVDHKDCDPTNDRWLNLREAD